MWGGRPGGAGLGWVTGSCPWTTVGLHHRPAGVRTGAAALALCSPPPRPAPPTSWCLGTSLPIAGTSLEIIDFFDTEQQPIFIGLNPGPS